MRRIDLRNVTRVASREDIMDARCEQIEVWANPTVHSDDIVVLQMNADTARALARMLNRHANFLKPPKGRTK